jgi:plasmid segregation protein ParM
MLPQPVGSVFNLQMNSNGEVTHKELIKKKVGVIDVGFRITDSTILDHMKYVDRGSCTVETGISTSFDEIANHLREMTGIAIELYRLYKAVKAGAITIRVKKFNISSLRDQAYSVLAGKIAEVVNKLWAHAWDIEAIISSGCGSKDLMKNLQPLIPGNVIPSENNADTRLNNVQGYLKYGKYKWKQAQ